VTLFGLGIFLIYLLAFRRKPKPQAVSQEGQSDVRNDS
jgi:hypothetical protein